MDFVRYLGAFFFHFTMSTNDVADKLAIEGVRECHDSLIIIHDPNNQQPPTYWGKNYRVNS